MKLIIIKKKTVETLDLIGKDGTVESDLGKAEKQTETFVNLNSQITVIIP